MSAVSQKERWAHAIALYDQLAEAGWAHIPAFRQVVAELSATPAAARLTAVTSHEILTISPYTRYPDWFEGRHVRLEPLSDGRVRIELHRGRFDMAADESWSVPVGEAAARIARLLEDL